MLQESNHDTWAFKVKGAYHLDAPQKAKSHVAQEYGRDYTDLRARVIGGKSPLTDTVVSVVDMNSD